jgi:hypothetical protein
VFEAEASVGVDVISRGSHPDVLYAGDYSYQLVSAGFRSGSVQREVCILIHGSQE